jgi:hypothetical protein
MREHAEVRLLGPGQQENRMAEPTKGLRLAFKPGLLGLHFTWAGTGKEPYPESQGPSDMAYINELIEEDEQRRATKGETDE